MLHCDNLSISTDRPVINSMTNGIAGRARRSRQRTCQRSATKGLVVPANQIENSLGGQVAMVTGGANGIGKAICEVLVANGAHVYVADIDAAAAKDAVSAMARPGALVDAVWCDVSDASSVASATAAIVAEAGRIDILVHCAAIFARGASLDLAFDDWARVINVNVNGTFLITREVSRQMVAQQTGTILMLTSDRGLYGAPKNGPYAASKGAMIAHMRTLALELAGSGITVNAVNPGTTLTDRLVKEAGAEHIKMRERNDPMGRLSTPDDIAGLTLFLVSPAGRFMTGQLVTTRIRQA